MAASPLAGRVEALENSVSSIEQRIEDFAEETRREFAAVRAEMRSGDEETRRQMHEMLAETAAQLEATMNAGDEETRRQMRVLHEDVIGRIALISEAVGRPKRNRRRRK